MYNKYDDMKSLTIKKIMAKVKTTFLPKLWNILCKMARTMQCLQNGTPLEIIQKQERGGLEK
jgi:hypothetical protein